MTGQPSAPPLPVMAHSPAQIAATPPSDTGRWTIATDQRGRGRLSRGRPARMRCRAISYKTAAATFAAFSELTAPRSRES